VVEQAWVDEAANVGAMLTAPASERFYSDIHYIFNRHRRVSPWKGLTLQKLERREKSYDKFFATPPMLRTASFILQLYAFRLGDHDIRPLLQSRLASTLRIHAKFKSGRWEHLGVRPSNRFDTLALSAMDSRSHGEDLSRQRRFLMLELRQRALNALSRGMKHRWLR
jgi:hypothetical protein